MAYMTPFQPTPGRTRKTRKDLISPLLLLHTYVQEKKILGEALFQKRISAHMTHFNCATYGTWHGPSSSCSEYRVRGGAKLVENEFGNIMRGEREREKVLIFLLLHHPKIGLLVPHEAPKKKSNLRTPPPPRRPMQTLPDPRRHLAAGVEGEGSVAV